MNFIKKHKKALIVITIMALIYTIVAYAAPGDSGDPLVTLSYITNTLMPDIDSKIDAQVEKQVSEKMDELENKSYKENKASLTDGATYTLVSVKANRKVIGGEGTEFILRMGSGTILATRNGGVADVTAGIDLPDGTPIPSNHLLVSPKDDSRGLKITSDSLILIRGTYTVTTK